MKFLSSILIRRALFSGIVQASSRQARNEQRQRVFKHQRALVNEWSPEAK